MTPQTIHNECYTNRLGVGLMLILQQYNVGMEGVKEERPSSERVPPALAEVYHLHEHMQKTIEQMDVKIEDVIRSHEAEFLLAYRNHIKRIKLELSEIKSKSEEQQKKLLSNNRSVLLEKQIIIFREEALHLYDKLEILNQQHQATKTKCRELQKSNDILQKQNRDQGRQIKIFQTEKTLLQAQIETLTLENQQLKEEVALSKEKVKGKMSLGPTSNTNANTISEQEQKKFKTPKAKESFNLPLPLQTRKTIQPQRKEIISNKGSFLKERRSLAIEFLDHELKSYFAECLQTIRREVAQRKVYGFKSEDITSIGSWQEFRMIDKLRLLEMFMQNEKLLVWMYEKVFPTRIAQLEKYFTKKKQAEFENREKSKSMNIQLGDIEITADIGAQASIQEVGLPRVAVRAKKDKKYDVRSRIQLKQGKLQFSQNNEET